MKRPSSAMDVDTPSAKRRKGAYVFRSRGLTKTQTTAVKKLITKQQELKFFGFTSAATEITSTWTLNDIFLPIQGDRDFDRNGDRVKLCGHLDIRLDCGLNALSTDPYTAVRFIVFQWHPASVPTAADILLPGPTAGRDLFSHYNHDGRQQYTILWDWETKLVSNGTAAATPLTPSTYSGPKCFVIPLRMKKSHPTKSFDPDVQFSAGGTAGTNKIYYMVVSTTGGAAGHRPLYDIATKLVFRDS